MRGAEPRKFEFIAGDKGWVVVREWTEVGWTMQAMKEEQRVQP